MTSIRKLGSVERRKRRLHLLDIQGGKCFWCNKDLTRDGATLDELLPRGRGGTQRWDNIVAACKPCNNNRSNFVAPKWAFDLAKSREAERRAALTVQNASK